MIPHRALWVSRPDPQTLVTEEGVSQDIMILELPLHLRDLRFLVAVPPWIGKFFSRRVFSRRVSSG